MKKAKHHATGKPKTNPAKNFNLRLLVILLAVWGGLSYCTSRPDGNTSSKFEQYYVHGQALYLTHCSNCHQKNGSGLGMLYPPLDTSDYMQHNMESVLCLIRNGKNGELIVNGKSYNQAMPGVPALSDLEVAEIATFIYNSWSHQGDIIDVKRASEILSKCDSLR